MYKKHFEEGHLNFVDTMKEQDSALRSLFQQILEIETQIDATYEYFSGKPIEHLPYETERGRVMYEELQRIEKERLELESKRGAMETTTSAVDEEDYLDDETNSEQSSSESDDGEEGDTMTSSTVDNDDA